MGEMFAALGRAVEGAAHVALAASFTWGILSIVLSPCHLASIPLVVGFVNGQGRMSTRRAFFLSALFSLGILVTIAAVGVVTAAAGRIIGDIGRVGNYIVAAVLIVVGLALLDVIPLSWPGSRGLSTAKKGPMAAFVLGLAFGVAVGPCTFAFMAPMLGVALRTASTSPAYGALLLLVYGIGHSAVIVLAGTFTEVVQRYLNWTERSRGAVILRRVCGVLVMLGGIYFVVTAV
jgi:cytochrome c-type biogenesis protein